ncbi:MAG: hypothetical protein K2J90_13550, partial [Lachnospiraceae bacterium]|nr:hypothetical protein [Lachnospiraceae bacterium]
MMIARNIRADFAKILSGYGFYVCILFTSILCFATYIYEDEDNGNKYSVFRSFISFDREYMLNNTMFCSFDIIRRGTGSWLFLFIPIIAAFSFVPLVCDEYEARSVRFEVFRSTKLCYYGSRFITACLCGGFSIMLGFLLFMCVVHVLFPFIGDYNLELRSEYKDMLEMININISGSAYVMTVVKKMGEMFLYGA